MIIDSDIIRFGFVDGTPSRGLVKVFATTIISTAKLPLWRIEVFCFNGESQLKIEKHEKRGNGWMYRIKFDGVINSPKDLRDLFHWIKLP